MTWKPVATMIASTSRTVPSARDDRVRADLGDAVGDQVDVVAGERRVLVVGDQDALAADLLVGRDRARAARGR